jgi:transcriptional regulator with XRE-family HTH domain
MSKTIGERIKEQRKKIGLSVDDLAFKLGKNRATIYRYESEEIENLSVSIIDDLAKALHISPAYLMGWEEKAPLITLNEELTPYGQKNKELLDLYHQLNSEGKNKLIEYAQDLINGGRYKKDISNQKMKNA